MTVKPYLRQWAPPAFSAMLPPMVQTVWELGSGGVEEAVRSDGGGDVGVDDAGLDGDLLVGEIDVQDAVHAGEADDDAAGRGGARRLRGRCRLRGLRRGMLCLAQDANDGTGLAQCCEGKDYGSGHDAGRR